MFRSEEMHFYELLFSKDSAYEVLDAIGKLESVQFVDLNQSSMKTNLHNIDQIKKADEVLSKIE
jgi:hypothetical protein